MPRKHKPRGSIRKQKENQDRRGAPDARGKKGGWVKNERVWRSDRAQTTARGTAGPGPDDGPVLAAATCDGGPGGYQKFGDIPAHRQGRTLRGELYRLANKLPATEHDNLAPRLKSAATTVTASLATGFGEGTFRAGVSRALESRGALMAIQDHLEHLADQDLLATEEHARLRQSVDQVVASVNEYLGRLVKEWDRQP